MTALHYAIRYKATETVVELLLKENPDAAKAKTNVRCPCAALAFAAPRRLPPARPGCLLPASALSATVRVCTRGGRGVCGCTDRGKEEGPPAAGRCG